MPVSKKTERYCLVVLLGILLAAACMFFTTIRKPPQREQSRALSLFLPDSIRLKALQHSLTAANKGFPAQRQYLTLYMNGDPGEEKTKLASSRLLIKKILTTNDTLNGINFHFTDHASYASFVNTIDLLKNEGAKRYLFMNNDIWFYHFAEDNSLAPGR